MSETTNPELNFMDELAASFWAVMPEEMANTVAGVKRDLLTSLRSTIDSVVEIDSDVAIAADVFTYWLVTFFVTVTGAERAGITSAISAGLTCSAVAMCP